MSRAKQATGFIVMTSHPKMFRSEMQSTVLIWRLLGTMLP